MTKENENLREVKEQDTWLVEIKKRSSMVCSSSFELKKLMVKEAVFLPVCIKEELEELEFTYDLTGKRSVEELKKESREKQYQFLINFEKLERVYEEYRISLSVENLYYDENMLPYVKHRDLYSQGEEADLEEYLFLYKSFVGGILGKRYSVQDIQEGGLEILKKDSFFQEYYSLESGAELAEKLREQKELYEKKKERYEGSCVQKRKFDKKYRSCNGNDSFSGRYGHIGI